MNTRGEKVCQFIERYCLNPEDSKVGQPIKLLGLQRKFILPPKSWEELVFAFLLAATSLRIDFGQICALPL